MTMENPDGCQSCDCDPSGTVTLADGTLAVCNRGTGECTCLTNRIGRRCEACRLGKLNNYFGRNYYDLEVEICITNFVVFT